MIRKTLTVAVAFLPAVLVIGPWLVLSLLGGRNAVVVITGMLPPGMGAEAFLLGFAYVFAYLAALVAGPPLVVTGFVWAATGIERAR